MFRAIERKNKNRFHIKNLPQFLKSDDDRNFIEHFSFKLYKNLKKLMEFCNSTEFHLNTAAICCAIQQCRTYCEYDNKYPEGFCISDVANKLRVNFWLFLFYYTCFLLPNVISEIIWRFVYKIPTPVIRMLFCFLQTLILATDIYWCIRFPSSTRLCTVFISCFVIYLGFIFVFWLFEEITEDDNNQSQCGLVFDYEYEIDPRRVFDLAKRIYATPPTVTLHHERLNYVSWQNKGCFTFEKKKVYKHGSLLIVEKVVDVTSTSDLRRVSSSRYVESLHIGNAGEVSRTLHKYLWPAIYVMLYPLGYNRVLDTILVTVSGVTIYRDEKIISTNRDELALSAVECDTISDDSEMDVDMYPNESDAYIDSREESLMK